MCVQSVVFPTAAVAVQTSDIAAFIKPAYGGDKRAVRRVVLPAAVHLQRGGSQRIRRIKDGAVHDDGMIPFGAEGFLH